MADSRTRLRYLLEDIDSVIWADPELDEVLSAHSQIFRGVALERRSPTMYAYPDGRWVWLEDPVSVFYVGGVAKAPAMYDNSTRTVTFSTPISPSVLVTADFVASNIYYAAAEAKLMAAGRPEKQQGIIAQGDIRLNNGCPADQLRADAEELRKLGLPPIIEASLPRDQRR